MSRLKPWNKKQKGFIGFLYWLGYTLFILLINEEYENPFWVAQLILILGLIVLGVLFILYKILGKFFTWIGD